MTRFVRRLYCSRHSSLRWSECSRFLLQPLTNRLASKSWPTPTTATTTLRCWHSPPPSAARQRRATVPPVQSIIDSALDPAWGNQATNWVEVRVPAGTTFYEGAAASQGGLVGGGNQVFISRVDPSWVVGRGGF